MLVKFSANDTLSIKLSSIDKSTVIKIYRLLELIAKDISNQFLNEPTPDYSPSIDLHRTNSNARFNSIDDFVNTFSPNEDIKRFSISLIIMSKHSSVDVLLHLRIRVKIAASGTYDFYCSASSCKSQIVSEEALKVLCQKISSFDFDSSAHDTNSAIAPLDVRITSSGDERAYQRKISTLNQRIKLKHAILVCILTFVITLIATNLGIL